MSPRPFQLVLLAAFLAAVGCGAPPESSGERLGLELVMEQAVADELGSFQVVVLPNGRSRRCVDLQRSCVQQQVKADEPLAIQDSTGKTGRALLFPMKLLDGVQELGVNIPVGRDYVVIIEALSRTSPPRFLGSSCNYLEAVSSRNDPLIAAPITLAAVDCDPSFPP